MKPLVRRGGGFMRVDLNPFLFSGLCQTAYMTIVFAFYIMLYQFLDTVRLPAGLRRSWWYDRTFSASGRMTPLLRSSSCDVSRSFCFFKRELSVTSFFKFILGLWTSMWKNQLGEGSNTNKKQKQSWFLSRSILKKHKLSWYGSILLGVWLKDTLFNPSIIPP